MTRLDSHPDRADTATPRRRGAPKGNRNAWKHGGRSAAARAAREAARDALMARVPNACVLFPSLALASNVSAQLNREAAEQGIASSRLSRNETNNSVAQAAQSDGGIPPSD